MAVYFPGSNYTNTPPRFPTVSAKRVGRRPILTNPYLIAGESENAKHNSIGYAVTPPACLPVEDYSDDLLEVVNSTDLTPQGIRITFTQRAYVSPPSLYTDIGGEWITDNLIKTAIIDAKSLTPNALGETTINQDQANRINRVVDETFLNLGIERENVVDENIPLIVERIHSYYERIYNLKSMPVEDVELLLRTYLDLDNITISVSGDDSNDGPIDEIYESTEIRGAAGTDKHGRAKRVKHLS